MTHARRQSIALLLAAVHACALGCAGPWRGPCSSGACGNGCQTPYYGGAPTAAAPVGQPAIVQPGLQPAPQPSNAQPTIVQPPIVQPPIVQPSPYSARKPDASADGSYLIRGQSPQYPPSVYSPSPAPTNDYAAGSDDYRRGPTPISGGTPYPQTPTAPAAAPYGQPYQYGQPSTTYQPAATPAPAPAAAATYPVPQYPPYSAPPVGGAGMLPGPPLPPAPAPGGIFVPEYPGWNPESVVPGAEPLGTPAPLDILVEETRTGRFMFGVTVNSDAGVAGQVTIQENNFDIARPPTSWDDVMNGAAFRGAGQGLRIEAQPGSQVQRYLISFTEPYFLQSNVTMNASAFYFDRNYVDWSESRYGGRLALGYRLTPDLSVNGSVRAENVSIFNPRVLGVPELDRVLGKNSIYSGKVGITHDTRDLPFAPTEGHLIDLNLEQVFGDFDYSRAEINLAQYFMLRQRPDGSGRHTLAFSSKLGFSGSDTPLFENYFAGGYSTLRGFSYRGASPVDMTVRVGGQFQFINSVEYLFPITADDMVKGVVFTDFGTVEQDIAIRAENFRVAPGFGLRVNVPALGPAPLAFDFAFPVAFADTDDKQVFSFFFGATRQ